MDIKRYESPLSNRYVTKEMQYIFSLEMKFRIWRKLWIALAETEKELGLNITEEQINEMKKHVNNINYKIAYEREKQVKHDVMSHVYAFGLQCPKAKKIIHLGATSCYIVDNTDIIIMIKAMKIIKKKLINIIYEFSKISNKYKNIPTLSFTHFQAAQPTTIGKRITLWMQEFIFDLEDLNYIMNTTKLLGSKGTTGTQASFLKLFNGNKKIISKIDKLITKKMGFKQYYLVTGQTYSRKIDTRILNILSGIAASAYKFSNDIRLLQHMKEIEEPFEKKQIGSSAMAYKRNPMKCERIASLSRFVIINSLNPAFTSASQWFERTLDDSANKRISISECFLTTDYILNLCLNIIKGLIIYPKIIKKRLKKELPFIITENIMMNLVKKGGDRQEIHERIRKLSIEANKNIKIYGKKNNFLELISNDLTFNINIKDLKKLMNPFKYIGCSIMQVETFLKNTVYPILNKNKDILNINNNINI